MSRTVNPDAYGTARPKIEPSDLKEDAAVLTIVEFEEVEVDDPSTESGKRMSGFLTFEETGDKVVWLNKTSITALCLFYGNDPDKWAGEPCPVEKVQGTAFGKAYHKVNVVPSDAWHEYVDDIAPPVRRQAKKSTKGTRKATKRRGRK